jgi:hypothetical protein
MLKIATRYHDLSKIELDAFDDSVADMLALDSTVGKGITI